jgi:rare lipoprotein A
MRGCLCVVAAAVGSAFLLAASAEASSIIKQEGLASWYKLGTHTANGERYDPMGITAAHPTLPFGTKVRVTSSGSGKSVVVRINDRGPFTGGRIIDLSKGAARAIELTQAGVAKVKIEVLGTSTGPEVAAVPVVEPVTAVAAETPPVTDAPPPRLMAEHRLIQSLR